MNRREQNFYAEQSIVVYGASGGLGAALCHELYGRVKRLILAGRSAEKLQKLSQDLLASNKKKTCQVEVWPLSEPLALAEKIHSTRVSGLIIATGKTIYHAFAKQEQTHENSTSHNWQDYRELLHVNVEQVLQLVWELLPYFRQKKGFIHISGSYSCIFPVPYQAVYSASKAALLSFVQAVCREQEADFGKQNVCGLLSISLIGGMATNMYYQSDLHKQFATLESLFVAPPTKIADGLLYGIFRRQKIITIKLSGSLIYHVLRRFPAAWLSYMFRWAYRPKRKL